MNIMLRGSANGSSNASAREDVESTVDYVGDRGREGVHETAQFRVDHVRFGGHFGVWEQAGEPEDMPVRVGVQA
ncbi:hypothetical protein ACFWF7_21135 [Nocardia sp. NPDC060256]|uniref:hypothetical protein n=1 Tax=unclassified Nocardia TaxID=2637762 RepID=UPI0036489E7F